MSMAKVVLITGASAGIGRATADRLHAAGWTVVGASRRGTSSGGWQALKMDVDDDADTCAGVAAVVREHGRLDAVVASAGWGLAGPVELTPIDQAKAQVETNFWGVVRVVQSALPAMRDQHGGRLVLVSSIGGLIALPFQAFYSASKYALEGYAEGLAYEVEPFGIHVTLLEPGNILTDFTASRRTIGTDPGGAYADAAAKAITLMEKDEMNGAPAESAAASIQRVLEARHPRRRVSVGKLGERIGIPAKRLLPHRLFEKAAGSSLGV
ncbi:MAG TPA: SDR family oxidoreductase [Acidimicrobiales bacterium]|jgi:NAD(P)-dependent dehydrogenase (short-subunit alcohol dehydrogenase family)|nr:SDR family oxidoreductase [Acidimicrobiales bacterium]